MTTPTLFLIAAPRAGSTQLAHWLDSHPDIAICPIKEPTHFAAGDFPPDHVAARHLNDVDPDGYVAASRRRPAQFAVTRSRATYEALFDGLTAPWRCDASTAYLACPAAPAAIRAAYPSARAITLTRDPVDRALSHYRLACRTGRTTASLAAELDHEMAGADPPGARFLIRPSIQVPGVARVRSAFGPTDHLPLTFEEMTADPVRTLGRIAAFLGIDPAGFTLDRVARNAGAAPRFAALNRRLLESGLKTRLRRHLSPGAKRLLKPLWFADPARIDLPAEHRAALAAAIAAAEREARTPPTRAA